MSKTVKCKACGGELEPIGTKDDLICIDCNLVQNGTGEMSEVKPIQQLCLKCVEDCKADISEGYMTDCTMFKEKPKADVRGVELTDEELEDIYDCEWQTLKENANKIIAAHLALQKFEGVESVFTKLTKRELLFICQGCNHKNCISDADINECLYAREYKRLLTARLTALQSAHDVEVKELERKVLDMLPMIYFILIDKKSDSTMRERLMEIKTKINKAFYE